MSSILIQINSLLFPYILGYRSENNWGDFVITNNGCTQLRGTGERKWYPFQTTPDDKYNNRLEVITSSFEDDELLPMFPRFLEDERIEDIEAAIKIVEMSKPYFLALHGDLQAQYHYGLTTVDPLTTTEKQKVAFIFPGTVSDLYDSLPEEEVTWASPMVGGSLGWLAHLTPSQKTLAGIIAAKKRLA